MAVGLPTWMQDNFILGFISGMVAAFAILAIWEYSAIAIRWLKRRRARRASELAIAKKALRPGPRPRRDEVPPAPAPPPPPPPVAEPATGPMQGAETQAMPAVRPSMFATPPPPPPTQHTHTVLPRDATGWDGRERRTHDEPPPEGEERRGRHSSPDNERRRRRDDAWQKYDDPQ